MHEAISSDIDDFSNRDCRTGTYDSQATGRHDRPAVAPVAFVGSPVQPDGSDRVYFRASVASRNAGRSPPPCITRLAPVM